MPSVSNEPAPVELDEGIIQMVMSMGFSRVRAERAAFFTAGSDAQAAVEWIFQHADDADIDSPLPKPSSTGGGSKVQVNEEAVENLMNMGFSRNQYSLPSSFS